MTMGEISSEVRRAAARHLVRTDFYAFLVMWFAHRFPELEGVAYGWRFRALAHALRSAMKPGGRLLLSLPPFLGASTLVGAVWTAWRLGCDPTLSIVCVSSSKAAGRKQAEVCRDILAQGWYKDVFPGTTLARSTLDELRTTRGGGRFCASFNSARPTSSLDLLILNEPLSIAEARSDTVRARRHTWLSDAIAEASGAAGRGVSVVMVSPRVHLDDFAGRRLHEGGWDHLELPAITSQARRVAISDTEAQPWAAGSALDPDGHPPEALDTLRQQIGPSVFDTRYLQRPALAGPAQEVRGWPRFEATEVANSPRPTVWSWVLRVEGDTDEVVATGACLAGAPVLDGAGKIAIAMAAQTPPVSRRLAQADVLGLRSAERGPDCRLLAVTETRLPLSELPAHLQAARRRLPADNFVLEASAVGRRLLETGQQGQDGAFSASEIEPAAARALLLDAIGSGRLILPMEAAARSSLVEDELARLQAGVGPVSPTLLAIAQGLHLLRAGEAVVKLSIQIGIPGDVVEEDDEPSEAGSENS